MNTDSVVERLDIFKNQFICMSIIENFETINPLSFKRAWNDSMQALSQG